MIASAIGSVAPPARAWVLSSGSRSPHSLEIMLNAAGYSETRVAYSGHAALAIAAEFRPSIVVLGMSRGRLDRRP